MVVMPSAVAAATTAPVSAQNLLDLRAVQPLVRSRLAATREANPTARACAIKYQLISVHVAVILVESMRVAVEAVPTNLASLGGEG